MCNFVNPNIFFHPSRFQAVLNLVRQRAAFIYFQKMELERARELFIRGKVGEIVYRVACVVVDY